MNRLLALDPAHPAVPGNHKKRNNMNELIAAWDQGDPERDGGTTNSERLKE